MIVGIDTGLVHPAISIIDDSGEFIDSFKIDPSTKTSLQHRFTSLSYHIRNAISKILDHQKFPLYLHTQIVIEMPGFQSSLKGQKSAERQDLSKLCASFGCILTIFLEFFTPDQISLVTPIEWKGQVPKKVTRMRMKQRYGELVDSLSSDQVDGLGIAVYYYENNRAKPVSPGEVTKSPN